MPTPIEKPQQIITKETPENADRLSQDREVENFGVSEGLSKISGLTDGQRSSPSRLGGKRKKDRSRSKKEKKKRVKGQTRLTDTFKSAKAPERKKDARPKQKRTMGWLKKAAED